VITGLNMDNQTFYQFFRNVGWQAPIVDSGTLQLRFPTVTQTSGYATCFSFTGVFYARDGIIFLLGNCY